MERRFACPTCGKCCHGQLPLTIDDALAHAGAFPLVVTWTPVRQGGRSFDLIAELGITVPLKQRRKAAVQITPAADIPPGVACPHLTAEGLCAVHATKPQRCRTMPFSAYRDEADQDDLLVPRAGWACDTSAAAPIVYRERAILDRAAFAAERAALVRDAAVLKPYGEWLLDAVPSLRMEIQKVATKPAGGQVVVAFSTLIPRLPKVDAFAFAAAQHPVMKAFASRTAGNPALAACHRRYAEGAAEWETIAARGALRSGRPAGPESRR